jgi:hypothetical protein
MPENSNRFRKFATIQLPVIIYKVVGLGYLFQGIRYLTKQELMPYHLAVIDENWENLDSAQQTLFLGLLKGFGAGSFCVGLTMILLAFLLLKSRTSWSLWVTPVIGISYSGLMVYVTNFALLPRAIPIAVTVSLLGLTLLAALCSFGGNDQTD